MGWRFLIIATVVFVGAPNLHAQGALWGNEFVIAIGSLGRALESDSIYLFILPTVQTQCDIFCRSCRDGKEYHTQFFLTDTRRSTRIGIPRSFLEQPFGREGCGVITLRSRDPVLVLALINDSVGGEAASILPTGALGRTYVLPSNLPSIQQDSTHLPLASLFATIIAPQASMVTIISPNQSCRINGLPVIGEQRLLLEAGEQCLIEFEPVSGESIHRGIIIHSTQPVAVFWGGRNGNGLLYEQCLAAEYWGDEYVLREFPLPAGSESAANDYALVVAVNDSTLLYYEDTVAILPQAGDCIALPLKTVARIRSSQPTGILALRQQTGSAAAAQCVTIVPPITGCQHNITVISPQLRSGVFRLYTEQYISIVNDGEGTSLTVDGAPWSGEWKTTRDERYRTSLRRVGDDIHTIQAKNGRILAWMIGYGDRRAYSSCGDFAAMPYPYLMARFRIDGNPTITTWDTFTVHIVLSQLVLPPPLLQIGNPARARLRLRWNATVAAPLQTDLQGSIRDGYYDLWLDISAPQRGFRGGDTLASLTLLAALGELPIFRVVIDSVAWFEHSGTMIRSRFQQEGGTIAFSDIWQDDWGQRLVSSNGGSFKVSVVPNPVQESAIIVFVLPRSNEEPFIELFDAVGERVATFRPTAAQVANNQIPLPRGGLPSGIYFLRVVVGTRSLVIPVVFQ